jgi:hypothetical protein
MKINNPGNLFTSILPQKFFRFPLANFWCGRRKHNRPYQPANLWNPFEFC